MMERKLLVVVDYQVDFVAEDGKLTAGKPAQALEAHIATRIAEYLDASRDVAFTMDTHEGNTWSAHPESASFPLHCEKGAPGWEIYGTPAGYANRAAIVEKAGYCPAFSVIESWVREYDAIEILGVTTDICVFQTSIALYTAKVNTGSPARLRVDDAGCASFDPDGHAYALKYMHEKLGM